MLLKDYFAAALLVGLTFDVHSPSHSCQNAFQSILNSHQRSGKFPRTNATKLLGAHVISKIQCLDLCLRNTKCDFFDMKKTNAKNSTRPWICSVKQRVSAQDTELVPSKVWLHFNISSHNLQEVSSLNCKILFCSTSAWTWMIYRLLSGFQNRF